MMLFCIAALATFMTQAHRRADAIRLRVERQAADVPRSLPAHDAAKAHRRVL